MDPSVNLPEKEFSGTEKSMFMEEVRKTIVDLMEVLVKTEAELITSENTRNEVNNYLRLRSYFRNLILLTGHKIDDSDFLKKCKAWTATPVKTDKEERSKDVTLAGELIESYFGRLTDIGIIDIHGNSFSNKYPFAEIVYENIGIIDSDYLSEFDQGIIEFIIQDTEKRKKEKQKEKKERCD